MVVVVVVGVGVGGSMSDWSESFCVTKGRWGMSAE